MFIAPLLDFYWPGCSTNWDICPFMPLVDNPNVISPHCPSCFESRRAPVDILPQNFTETLIECDGGKSGISLCTFCDGRVYTRNPRCQREKDAPTTRHMQEHAQAVQVLCQRMTRQEEKTLASKRKSDTSQLVLPRGKKKALFDSSQATLLLACL